MPTVYKQRTALMQGKGLRPVLRYCRVSPVYCVRLETTTSPIGFQKYGATFYFDDGAECSVTWQDWRVFLTWILARRSWSVDRITVKGADLYEMINKDDRTAVIRGKGTGVHMVA